MTVFKGYYLIIRRNIFMPLLYIGIFLGITSIVQASYQSMVPAQGFSAYRMKTAVIDRAGGVLADTLRSLLERKQEMVEIGDDLQAIRNALYYRTVEYVLILPEDLEARFAAGESAVQRVTAPGSVMGFYIDTQVNAMLNQVRLCLAGGLSMEDACARALELSSLSGEVRLSDRNGNSGILPGHNYYFRFMPYAFLGSVITTVSLVLMEFKKKELKSRMQCSAVPLYRQNLAAAGAFLTVGVLVWLICIAFGTLVYRRPLLTDRSLGLYLLNSFVFMLAALSLGYLSGILSRGPASLNGINNVISLGMCFLGGVFVPIGMLDRVEMVSQFLPTYWYMRINDLLGSYETVPRAQMGLVFEGLAVQVLFAAACFAVTLALASKNESRALKMKTSLL